MRSSLDTSGSNNGAFPSGWTGRLITGMDETGEKGTGPDQKHTQKTKGVHVVVLFQRHMF